MMFESLRDRILSLPEEEQRYRRAFYSDEEWENSWELRAYPFQLPPAGDWTSWSVIGGRRVGKTEAGRRWAVERFREGGKVVAIFHHYQEIGSIGRSIWDGLITAPDGYNQYTMKVSTTGSPRMDIRDSSGPGRLTLLDEYSALKRGASWDCQYLWADEISDASRLRDIHRNARQYVFTGPVKLDPYTIVSRAGDGRVF